jgi:hypothetical protein
MQALYERAFTTEPEAGRELAARADADTASMGLCGLDSLYVITILTSEL